MAILNYTTTVAFDKTIGEINGILAKRGARKIVTDYDEQGNPIALTFSMSIQAKPVFYSMPCNWDGVLRAMQKDSKVPGKFCNKEQALRVSWRIIKDWIDAQMAIIDAQLAKVEEVFLPYAITKSGDTLFKHIESGKSNLLLGE